MLNLPIDPINIIGISPLLALLIYWLVKTLTTTSSANELNVSGFIDSDNSTNGHFPLDAPLKTQTENSTSVVRSNTELSQTSLSQSDQPHGRTASIDGSERSKTVEAPIQQQASQQDSQVLRACAKPPQAATTSIADTKNSAIAKTKDLADKNKVEQSSASPKAQPRTDESEAGTVASTTTPFGANETAQTNVDHYRSVAKSTNHTTRDEVTTTISAHTFVVSGGTDTELPTPSKEPTSKELKDRNNDKIKTDEANKNSQADSHSITVPANASKSSTTQTAEIPSASSPVSIKQASNKLTGSNPASSEVANLAEVKLEKELARNPSKQQGSKDRPQSKIELAMARQFAEKSNLKVQANASTQARTSQSKGSASLASTSRDQIDPRAETSSAETTNELATAVASATTDKLAVNTSSTSSASTSAVKATTATITASPTSNQRPTLLSKVRILDM